MAQVPQHRSMGLRARGRAARSRDGSICHADTSTHGRGLIIRHTRLDPALRRWRSRRGPSRIVFYAGRGPQPGPRPASRLVLPRRSEPPRLLPPRTRRALARPCRDGHRPSSASPQHGALAREVELRRLHESTIHGRAPRSSSGRRPTRLLSMAEQMATVGHWRMNFARSSATLLRQPARHRRARPGGSARRAPVLLRPLHARGPAAGRGGDESRGRGWRRFSRSRRASSVPDGSLRDVMIRRGTCKRERARTIGLFGILMDNHRPIADPARKSIAASCATPQPCRRPAAAGLDPRSGDRGGHLRQRPLRGPITARSAAGERIPWARTSRRRADPRRRLAERARLRTGLRGAMAPAGEGRILSLAQDVDDPGPASLRPDAPSSSGSARPSISTTSSRPASPRRMRAACSASPWRARVPAPSTGTCAPG